MPFGNSQPLDDCHGFKLLTCDVHPTMVRGISWERCTFSMLVLCGCGDHAVLSFPFLSFIENGAYDKIMDVVTILKQSQYCDSWHVVGFIQFDCCLDADLAF